MSRLGPASTRGGRVAVVLPSEGGGDGLRRPADRDRSGPKPVRRLCRVLTQWHTMTNLELVTAADVQLMQGLTQRVTAVRPGDNAASALMTTGFALHAVTAISQIAQTTLPILRPIRWPRVRRCDQVTVAAPVVASYTCSCTGVDNSLTSDLHTHRPGVSGSYGCRTTRLFSAKIVTAHENRRCPYHAARPDRNVRPLITGAPTDRRSVHHGQKETAREPRFRS